MLMSIMCRGLAVVLAEDVPAIAKSDPPGKATPYPSFGVFSERWSNIVAAWDQLCPIYDALPAEVFT
jgi:hypothetical protein